MKTHFLTMLWLILIISCSCQSNEMEEKNNSEIDENKFLGLCQFYSLLPYLSAEMCLPPDCQIVETSDFASRKEVDYYYVNLEVVFPTGEKIFIEELARIDSGENISTHLLHERMSNLKEEEIHSTENNYFVQLVASDQYKVHFYIDYYGYPYYLSSSILKDEESVEKIIKNMNSFEFTPN